MQMFLSASLATISTSLSSNKNIRWYSSLANQRHLSEDVYNVQY